jgi:tRNA-specific 2-thiouridylase
VIAVAMSGGVDSSVAAALLAESGDRVFGLMLRLWSAGERYPNRCCSPQDVTNARRVAERLKIPFYVLDAQEPFERAVVRAFVEGYRDGVTPNPCLTCNRQIRWGLLRDRALALGATHLATGHYARIEARGGGYRLYRALDRLKDQSYVLNVLGQDELRQTILPLGELLKPQVRKRARELELETAERVESQDLCFLGGTDYREFLTDYGGLMPVAGAILDVQGSQIGSHAGLHQYTIGQRKGIGIAGPEPLYVIAKDRAQNTITVGTRAALQRTTFPVSELHWVAGTPPSGDRELTVQVRYRATPQPCAIRPNMGDPTRATVELGRPVHAVTPGQAAVFYQGDECLGGGLITQ